MDLAVLLLSAITALCPVAGPALLPIYVIEIGVFVMAAGILVMALKMGRMEEL